jgi:FecR protein
LKKVQAIAFYASKKLCCPPLSTFRSAQLLKRSLLFAGIYVSMGGIVLAQSSQIQVRVERWLEVSQLYGTVNIQQGGNARSAQVGDRLQSVGDSLRTGSQSNAVLTVDTAIGIIAVSPNTSLRVQELEVLESGGQTTRLEVTGGQARFLLRDFTNPDSYLEIETPAGSSAVRGTEFGVSVQPDGFTAIATLEGSVEAEAQGRSVEVNAGFQSTIHPGEQPSDPVPLSDNIELRLELLTVVDGTFVRVRGQVDSVNLVQIVGSSQNLDDEGRFEATVPLPPDRRIEVLVIAPSGRQQRYGLIAPR